MICRRKAKKMLKTNLRKYGSRPRIKILKTVGKVYIIEPIGTGGNQNIACIRYWDFVAITINHPKLSEMLIRYGKKVEPYDEKTT